MNKTRRKQIEGVISRLEELQEQVSILAEEERDAFDNLPEGLQESERGEQMSENADNLEECDTDFEDLLDKLREIVES